MGYSVHDWFCEKALPELLKAVEAIKTIDNESLDLNTKSEYEIFIEWVKLISEKEQYRNSDKVDRAAGDIIGAFLGTEEPLQRKMQSCFNLLSGYNDGIELKKLVYTDNGDVVTCDYAADIQD